MTFQPTKNIHRIAPPRTKAEKGRRGRCGKCGFWGSSKDHKEVCGKAPIR